MKVSRWIALAGVISLATVVLAAAALAGATKQTAGYKAALVSDVVGFNDAGFNRNQLIGLNKAVKKIGGVAIPKVSHSTSDYAPNFNAAIRAGAQLVVAAGYLLGPTIKTYSKQFPKVDFAITDDTFQDAGGGKNVEGITYSTEQGGCLVGILAAKMAKKLGEHAIGAVGGIKLPSVDQYIAGYRFCAAKAVPGTKTIVRYSNDFAAEDKCQTVAQNEIGQGAKVIFPVAGGCGIGALKAAAAAGGYGIGVDVDQYHDAARILTSATKHTDTGVYDVVLAAAAGHFKGGTNLVFNLKNKGVGLGKINPAVPKAWITLVNSYKAKIIAGKFKIPTKL